MKATSTVENYLKQIFLAAQGQQEGMVSMGRVAGALQVSPGTATTMVKSLERDGWLSYTPRSGVCLTAEGRTLALHVLRRHRLVEYFLVNTLGMDWSEIHEEAEALEHAISDRLLEHLDRFLGRPVVDPHGDPIPSADGQLEPSQLVSLDTCGEGTEVVVGRIADQDEAFLNFASRAGLVPGTSLSVIRRDEAAGSLEVRFAGGSEQALGLSVAAKIEVLSEKN